MRNRFAERGKQVVSALAILAVIGSASAFAAPALDSPEADAQDASQTAPRVDPRWLPWVGCWEMFADTINSQKVESVGALNVCIIPRSDAPGVRVVTLLDGRAVFEESVVADLRFSTESGETTPAAFKGFTVPPQSVKTIQIADLGLKITP